jgi:hypothetical protein
VLGALVFALSSDVVQFETSKECRGAFSSGFGGGFETRHCAVVVRKTGSDEKIRIPLPQQSVENETKQMPEHYEMKAEPGAFVISGNSARLKHTTVAEATRRNWPLLGAYGLITLASVIASYFISQWVSVAVSFAFAVITFLVGLRMLIQVVTITNEMR